MKTPKKRLIELAGNEKAAKWIDIVKAHMDDLEKKEQPTIQLKMVAK